MSRPLVIISESIDDEPLAWLAERCRVVCSSPVDDPDRFAALASETRGLIVRTYTRVDAALLTRLPGLMVVGRAGVGLDNIDLDACRAAGVRVVHRPGANTRAVVEFVLSVVVHRARPIQPIRTGELAHWHEIRATRLADRELGELTLGIWGFGRIGSALARAGGGLFGRVLYTDLREIGPDDRAGAEPVSAKELARRSDVLSVHVDARPTNRGLINAGVLGRLRPDVHLINTSRGFVVDVPALAEFARARPEASVLLDVHDPEPISPDSPLWGIGNVTLTPHVAANSRCAKREMGWVVRDIWRVIEGQDPEHAAV